MKPSDDSPTPRCSNCGASFEQCSGECIPVARRPNEPTLGGCDLCGATGVPVIHATDAELEVSVTYCEPCRTALRRVWEEEMGPEDRAEVEADIQAERDYLREQGAIPSQLPRARP